ncbi:hypothetical protein M728_005897 (plasmid) [Ensifer sp. WSM1721]
MIEAGNNFGRFFTGQVTAAGKVPPDGRLPDPLSEMRRAGDDRYSTRLIR